MGMTDRQFDAYQESLIRNLQKALEEIEKSGSTKELEDLIAELRSQLKRP